MKTEFTGQAQIVVLIRFGIRYGLMKLNMLIPITKSFTNAYLYRIYHFFSDYGEL